MIKIKARIAVTDGAGQCVDEGWLSLKEGTSLKGFLKKVDRELGYGKRKPVRQTMKMKIPPTVLINGDRAEIPEEFDRVLKDGDEITVLSPLTGG